jgi:hypothetical protein
MLQNLANYWSRLAAAGTFAIAVWCLSATTARASGGGGHGGHGEAAPAKAEADPVSDPSADGSRAVKLGEFSIRVYHTVSTRKDNVSFILQAVVSKDKYEAFEHIYSHRKNKVRDQVVVATRLVPIDDYDDPELKKFRRRILLRLRRTLPELPIEDVYLSDFSLMSEST